MRTEGQTDRHDEANNRVRKFWKASTNTNRTLFFNIKPIQTTPTTRLNTKIRL